MSMSVSESRAVSMSTGTALLCWMRRHTSRPSSPGSMRSRITRSGLNRSHSSMPEDPLAAVSTSKPSLRNRAAIDAAIVCSSSTTATVRRSMQPVYGEGLTGCVQTERVEDDGALLGLVELEEEQALPSAQERLPAG